jgi:hypothetical protein
MKVLTEPQVERVIVLLLRIEKARSKEETVGLAEAIRATILEAEKVTLKLEQ